MTVKYSGTDFCPIKPEIARFLSDLLWLSGCEKFSGPWRNRPLLGRKGNCPENEIDMCHVKFVAR